MAIPSPKRLQQAAKDLQIGMLVAVEYLASVGHTIESKPTTKLTAEEVQLLNFKFGDSDNPATQINLNAQDKPRTQAFTDSYNKATTFSKLTEIRKAKGIPKSVFKFYGTQDYHFESLREGYFFLSLPSYFNDPFDCDTKTIDFTTTASIKPIRKPERLFRERINNIGVCCFSRNNSSILMWSHYANSHRGFCLEFISDIPDGIHPLDVHYTSDFQTLNFHLFADDSIANMIYTKSSQWAYEEELRLLGTNLKNNEQRKMSFNKSSLKSVYLGVNCELSTLDKIKEILSHKYKNTKLFQAKKVNNKFALEFQEVRF
ncbi:Protein of unknown function [Hymenobacter daecheongensis DSM 21074]|uniref:DUF2971 domain-containing protein n=1 Tax=Hymenobacter daecheongensis DSM 21074 TaxID=1121955 RepID=A0A1M6EMQ8_9BACT|nr:DUF2971 domain-containing protein [Hymenobacter daecheongensis]SHI86706.1 Protein of unknown function [Hymenobacter daecheongensis DSM 21074]